MMRVDQPYSLILLLLLPMAGLMFMSFLKWRKRALNQWGSLDLLPQIFPGLSHVRVKIKFGIWMLVVVLMILALMNLQTISSERNEKSEGIDLAIAIDVSASMLANDVKPNRLEAAKERATSLLQQFPNERIALIAFAAEATTLVPLTPDHSSLFMMINSLDKNNTPLQGSDLAEAIQEGSNALPDNQFHNKVLVLISDGEDHEGRIDEAIELARDNGLIVFTIGIGTTQGSFIPDSTLKSNEVKMDEKGIPVVTKLQPTILQEIAKKSGGMYFTDTDNASKEISEQLRDIGKNEYSKKILAGYESRFQYFLAPAILLLLLEFFISNRNRKKKIA